MLLFDVHETGTAFWSHCMFTKQSMSSRYYVYYARTVCSS